MVESLRHALPAISSLPGSVMRRRLMLLAKIEGFGKKRRLVIALANRRCRFARQWPRESRSCIGPYWEMTRAGDPAMEGDVGGRRMPANRHAGVVQW